MSLGSIAHMQYYFARTGLLDGKGAQLAKQRKSGIDSDNERAITIADADGTISPNYSEHDFFGPAVSAAVSVEGQEQDEHCSNGNESTMLPPTVSTYKHKPDYVQPLPDIAVLRRELREALDDAKKLLEETNVEDGTSTGENMVSEGQGWYELQGLHILDIVTLAIRAAKNYYTCHNNPQKLYAIKSERDIRTELYHCLDLLKRTANRDFHGGLRKAEKQGMLDWIASIHLLLTREEEQEKQEQALRDQWAWLQGDWQHKAREREWMFLRSFDTEAEPLPEWSRPEEGPSPFLTALRDGVRLVRLHNELVKQSRRRFGEIKTYHTDVGKPYRCAENLRYWTKASELRWETRLDVNALDVVYGKDDATWKRFDEAILSWCKAVREELSGEWLGTDGGLSTLPPHIHVDLEV